MGPVVLVTCSGMKDGLGRRRLKVGKFSLEAIAKAGGIPVAACECGSEEDLADLADALLLTGGPDMDASYFGQRNLNETVETDPLRDEYEWDLTRAFIRRQKPILGICRGMQVLNIALGGDIWQDLPTETGTRHMAEETPIEKPLHHEAEALPGSELEAFFGSRFTVNSIHHQACRRLGEGLAVTCRGGDGIIEGFVHESLPFVGYQFHPEVMSFAYRDPETPDFSPLFVSFMNKVREDMKRRRGE